MIEVSVLVDKINDMDAEEIAEYMRSLGITGVKSCEYSCPLARWMIRQTSKQLAVGKTYHDGPDNDQMHMGVAIYKYGCDESVDSWDDFIELKQGPIDFITKFDAGFFEDLVLEDEDPDF